MTIWMFRDGFCCASAMLSRNLTSPAKGPVFARPYPLSVMQTMVRKSLAALFAASVTLGAADARAGILPNGWSVQPAGALTALGTLPLHMTLDKTGKWMAVT